MVESWFEKAGLTDVDSLTYITKLAERSERYDDMVASMRLLVKSKPQLTPDERNSLSVAYKNIVSARRTSWRKLANMEQKVDPEFKDQLEHLRTQIEKDLIGTCNELVGILDEIIPTEETAEGRVFYLKMSGDYNRYIAEVTTGTDQDRVREKAEQAYKEATENAQAHLTPANPILLGLALNYSVFYYEIMNQPQQACKLASDALKAALECSKDETDRDAGLVIRLLQDNLESWGGETTD